MSAKDIDSEAAAMLTRTKALLDQDKLDKISLKSTEIDENKLRGHATGTSSQPVREQGRSSVPTPSSLRTSAPPRPSSDTVAKENGDSNTRSSSREMRKGGPPMHCAEEEVMAYENELVGRISKVGRESVNGDDGVLGKNSVPPISRTRVGRLWGGAASMIMSDESLLEDDSELFSSHSRGGLLQPTSSSRTSGISTLYASIYQDEETRRELAAWQAAARRELEQRGDTDDKDWALFRTEIPSAIQSRASTVRASGGAPYSVGGGQAVRKGGGPAGKEQSAKRDRATCGIFGCSQPAYTP